MQRYINNFTDRNGNAIPQAVVSVYREDGTLAALYSDDGVTAQANPMRTDANGEFSFYAADGVYSITLAKNGHTARTISGVALLDGARVQAPVADYPALRAYAGGATSVFVLASGIAGTFTRDDADTTSADNGATIGTVIVDTLGRRWKRTGALIPLGGGSPSHSDGANTITGSARWFLGNATPSSDDSALLIGRSLTGSYSTGAHALRDETAYAASGTGLLAYASIDVIPAISGAAAYNHLRGFQARPQYAGSGSMGEISGIHIQAHSAAGSGTVALNHGVLIDDPTGTGTITNNYGIYIKPLTRGANNFSFYSQGACVFYNGGNGQFGGTLQIGGAFSGATTGAFSNQVTGRALDITGTQNSYTPAGGVAVQYSGSGTGQIRAYANVAGGGTAQLNIMGGATLVAQATSAGALLPGVADTTTLGNVSWRWANIFTNYVKTVPTTVASLTAAATAGAGARAFVSDATATTFASIVTGGGANPVPVYSDGTNWRIG
jgi:hypothetical protein